MRASFRAAGTMPRRFSRHLLQRALFLIASGWRDRSKLGGNPGSIKRLGEAVGRHTLVLKHMQRDDVDIYGRHGAWCLGVFERAVMCLRSVCDILNPICSQAQKPEALQNPRP